MCVRPDRFALIVVTALSLACQADPPIGPSSTGLRRQPRPRPAGASTGTPIALPTATATAVPTMTPTPGATPTATGTATPTARATATATATAAPTATPTPDDSGDPLQPGPVASATLRMFSARDEGSNTFRNPPFDDGNGNHVAMLGEIVIFDVTPRNAANKPCEAQGEPEWTLENNRGAGNSTDYLVVLPSSNPFLLRVRTQRTTETSNKVQIVATIDGKTANRLFVIVK